MANYHIRLWRNYRDLPILSVGLYLQVGREGFGWEEFNRGSNNHNQIQVRYPYIGLPALNAEDYLRGENMLGVCLTTLMRMPPNQRFDLSLEG